MNIQNLDPFAFGGEKVKDNKSQFSGIYKKEDKSTLDRPKELELFPTYSVQLSKK